MAENLRVTDGEFCNRCDVWVGGLYIGELRYWEDAGQWEIVAAVVGPQRLPTEQLPWHPTKDAAARALYRYVLEEVGA